ncbi:MAG: 1-deoxy-D-xylulose-5-phosphate reductoisomerase [Hyphomicrobiales bacterium]|nr:1-deoxy-D-xylulose-5-phosphate reductoisomerase [Hyphomicrobiales bacterium]
MVSGTANRAASRLAPAAGAKRLTLLGATGSIGDSTLDLIGREPERFPVEAVTANRNVARLAEAARRVNARLAVIAEPSLYGELRENLSGTGIEVAAGPEAVAEAAARPVDLVVAGIVGAAGLGPTMAAIRAGNDIALANKECLVCAGKAFVAAAQKAGITILPLDSEHNAVFQVFDGDQADGIEKVTLTASGGPFRTWSRAEMAAVEPEQALRHPNWEMGAKITIDSATMMNKGLEVIEAFHLFPVSAEQLDVLIHPQSVVHGLVAYSDGSILAQLGSPDMRTPIAHCLNWPQRGPAPSRRLDLAELGTLTFERPDDRRFPALRLAREALARGTGATNILNAANEIAVAAFLERGIGFLGISALVEATLDRMDWNGGMISPTSVEEAIALDRAARVVAEELLPEIRAQSYAL